MYRIDREPGSEVKINNTIYTIIRLLDSGGTSQIYEAREKMENGFANPCLIKEFYPENATRDNDENCSVICATQDEEDRKLFEVQKEQCIKECEMGGKAAAVCSQVISLNIAQNGFGVMKKLAADAIPLGQLIEEWIKNPPSGNEEYTDMARVRYSLRIVSKMLTCLAKIHENEQARILHGDLSLYNVFWSRPAKGDITEGENGTVYFIDFGSAIQLNSSGTASNTGAPATLSFAAPERRDPTAQLSPKTDLFSVAAILFILLVGKKGTVGLKGLNLVTRECVDRLYADNHRVVHRSIDKLNIPDNIKNALQTLLTQGLAENPDKRFISASDMNREVIRTLSDCITKGYPLKGTRRTSSGKFVGRNDEIEKLSGKICRNISPVFIHGMGGIGKTELALKAGEKLRSEGYAFYLVQYADSLRETVMNIQFDGLPSKKISQFPSKEGAEAEYQKRINLLSEYDDRTVLIIDGFDFYPSDDDSLSMEKELSGKEFQDLTKLNLQIIFITRNEVPPEYSNNTILVGELTVQELAGLFDPSTYNSSPDIIHDIITAVNRHTLTVDIAARALNHVKGLTPQHLLQLLQKKSYDDPSLSGIPKGREEKSILGHLRTVFDCSGFSETARKVLYCISLSNTKYIYRNFLNRCLDLPLELNDSSGTIALLINSGWINLYTDDDGIENITMHSLICMVCNDIHYMCIDSNTPRLYMYSVLLNYYTEHLMDEWITDQINAISDTFQHIVLKDSETESTMGIIEKNNTENAVVPENLTLARLLLLFTYDQLLMRSLKLGINMSDAEKMDILFDQLRALLNTNIHLLNTFCLGHLILLTQYYLQNQSLRDEETNNHILNILVPLLHTTFNAWSTAHPYYSETNLCLYYKLTIANYCIDCNAPPISSKSFDDTCLTSLKTQYECSLWDIAQFWWYDCYLTSAKASRKNGDYYHAISLIKQLFRIIQDFYLEHKLSSDEYLSELSGITLETANCFTCLEMDHEASCWINLHREITAIPLKMRTDDTLNNMIQTIKHRKEYMPAIHKYLGVPLDECDPWKDSSIIITREGYEAHLKVLSACRKKGDFLAYKAAKEKLALLIIEEDI